MIIVTGGAGFIGSVLLWKLNQVGIENILVVDDLGGGDKWRNLNGKHYLDYMHKGDFLDSLASGEFKEDVSCIFHLGACSSTTETDAEYLMANNYEYTKTLASWCLEHGARFVYASSAATYGDGKLGFSDAHEGLRALRPLNMYGYSKQLFDLWALRTGAIKEICGVKFFNVYGPNEYHKESMMSVICKAHSQILKTGKLKLFKSHVDDCKDGEQKRDFIYVKDCAEVLYQMMLNKSLRGTFNLGTGEARSFNDLARATFSAMGTNENIEYIDMPEEIRGNYQYFTEADMGKLKGLSDELSFTSLEDGVKDYVTGYLRDGGRC